jgi:hypothetical protein
MVVLLKKMLLFLVSFHCWIYSWHFHRTDWVFSGSKVVWLYDLDHFGPAYASFPGMGKYHPAALILTLIKLLELEIEENEKYFSFIRKILWWNSLILVIKMTSVYR